MAAVQDKKTVIDGDYSLEAVPSSARKGFISMFFIMLGFTFFSASMWTGVSLAQGLDMNGFIGAVVIGGAILAAYTGVLGYIGCETGLSFDLLAHKSFGSKGSYLPSAMISFTQIGWFGVGAAMFAIPAASELNRMMGTDYEWLCYVLVAIVGVCMTGSAYFGIKALEIVSYISVPLIAILGTWSMTMAIRDGGGFVAMFNQSSGSLSLFTGVGLVIGSFVSGGTATPNFVRFAKDNKTAVITTVIAFFLGNTLMFVFGGTAGAFANGANDIFYVMIAQGLAIPAFIVLGANIWTTNDNALYTGALGLSNITKVRKRPMVIVSGIIGTVAAVWLYNNFSGWLSVLNCTLPPIGAIIALDFFLNRDKYREGVKDEYDINWASIIGVICGAVVGNLVTWGIASINAMVVGCACYLIGRAVSRKGK
ncbi:MAG: cytosine permease [Clostridia bacterium]|nr:cytosine permease [Clostridia bacterium]